MTLAIVETTLPQDEATDRLVRTLVERRLAACANWALVSSLYWWNGTIEHDKEVHVSFKVSSRGRAALVEALREAHPYDVPFIAWHEPDGVDQAYADWASAESSSKSDGSRLKPVSD